MKPYVLTIAGSDPSAGAGIQKDLETFKACGVKGLSVITNITSQNEKVFKNIFSLPSKILSSQLDVIINGYPIKSAKTGLLYRKAFIDLLYKKLKKLNVKLIVDPVMNATLNRSLLQKKAYKSLINIIRQSYLVTPNINEANKLSGINIQTMEEMKMAAVKIHAIGAKNVIIKGGHLKGEPVDLLYDGDKYEFFKKDRIEGKIFHGLGCRFSAALTAFIALEMDIVDAFKKAEEYMKNEINTIVQE